MLSLNEMLWEDADPAMRIAAIQLAMGKPLDIVTMRFDLTDDELETLPELVNAYNGHPDFEGWLKTTGWVPKPWGGIEGTEGMSE